ncbi:MAG: four-carbon acid sugar kinase family protein [Bacteroidota bacterium]
MNPTIKILDQLPTEPSQNLSDKIQVATQQKNDHIIVLDDDPTGTQTVQNFPVLTTWSVEVLQKEMEIGSSIFYILTNSRALPQAEADELAKEIGRNIKTVSKRLHKKCMVISRSDSTLRGHYPSEVESLKTALGQIDTINILIPAFFEGGRYTINDIHYVKQDEQLIPAAQTPYAQDKSFGYQHSDLKDWVEEKTEGKVKSSEVISFSIEELRTKSIELLVEKLNQCPPNSTCIVNAADYIDLEVFALALMSSKVQVICRTAASFVAAIAGTHSRDLLQKEDLIEPENQQNGGLIVVGSYVPKTTQQLSHLQANTNINSIELDVQKILEAAQNNSTSTLLQIYATQVNKTFQSGSDLVVYTSRKLIATDTQAQNLNIGKTISSFLTNLVSQLEVRPKYLIAKGGITSSDVATESLQVKRAMVKGQVLPGVPVWSLGAESKFPDLSYIIFPGNVGEEDAITKVVQLLN